MGDPVLLYGVGATKAGTSWFYDYIQSHPQAHLRGVKELHYWDTFDPGEREVYTGNIQDYRAGLKAKLQNAIDYDKPKWANTLRRNIKEATAAIDMLNGDRSADAAYYQFMTENAAGARVAGDITPAYALCDEATLARMQTLAPTAKFIYLIRDPVARLWSHIRMIAQRRGGNDGRFPIRTNRILGRAVDGQENGMLDRGDYATVIEKLRRNVEADNLLVMFFEDLFTEEGIRHICAFLGLDYHPAQTDKTYFGSKPRDMSEEQRAKAARLLAPQYAYIEALFGHMPDDWTNNREAAA